MGLQQFFLGEVLDKKPAFYHTQMLRSAVRLEPISGD